MIEVKNIKKGFSDKTVINDVSAVMETGKCNLIIGASGSGKTVLMKCMVGLFKPDSGDILYENKSFTNMDLEEKKEIRKQIGMLFQGSAFSTARLLKKISCSRSTCLQKTLTQKSSNG